MFRRCTYVLLLVFFETVPPAFAQSPGKFGKAVNISATPLRTNTLEAYGTFPLSVEMWVNLPTEKKARYNHLASNSIEGSAAHWELYTTALDGLLSAKLSGFQPAEIPTFVRITDEEWHFLKMTCDGSRVEIFVDGRRVVNQTVKAVPPTVEDAGELFVGLPTEFADEQATVSLVDELRISNVIRTGSDVPVAPLPLDEHTVGLWRFDEQDGISRVDASNNRNVLAYSPGINAAWTPRPSTDPDAESWERETDADWLDDRFDHMDKSGLLGVSMPVPAVTGSARGPVVGKGLAINVGEAGEATVLFDRSRLQLCAAWQGGFLHLPSTRFGLIRAPEVVGEMLFSSTTTPGWERPPGVEDTEIAALSPLPDAWGRYEGLYRYGNRKILSYSVGGVQILDMPWVERAGDEQILTRTIDIAPSDVELRMNVIAAPAPQGGSSQEFTTAAGAQAEILSIRSAGDRNEDISVGLISAGGNASLSLADGNIVLTVAPRAESIRVKLLYRRGPHALRAAFEERVRTSAAGVPLDTFTSGGPLRWTETITTQLERGIDDDGRAFAVDNFPLPDENPYGSVFRVSGVACLPGGATAISTIYGDVWIVTPADDGSDTLNWKRFAAGLYQPFGIALKDGVLHVLERGQITALHDLNGDGEADFYQNVYNRWQTPGAGHAYDAAMRLAPDGSFFFLKGQSGGNVGNEGGTLVHVFPDASGHEIYATGFRHAIGLGVSPTGIVTSADQQGNWIPATRIDWCHKGGFCGHMGTHHRDVPPTTYDPPLCWRPRQVDNSAGGQVWIPEGHWGPLGGKPLHLSYGHCRVFVLMAETVDGVAQGGVAQLPIDELPSGVMAGMFNEQDDSLYLVGMHGWQTSARHDGCLSRIRYTGQPVRLPTELHARSDGIEIRFAEPLDRATAGDPSNYGVEQWGYRYSENYGSDHWSVKNPDQMGHDPVAVRGVELSEDGRSVLLVLEDFQSVL